jgi:hypothetical protein
VTASKLKLLQATSFPAHHSPTLVP